MIRNRTATRRRNASEMDTSGDFHSIFCTQNVAGSIPVTSTFSGL
jgi:hypothetical protein